MVFVFPAVDDDVVGEVGAVCVGVVAGAGVRA